MTLVAEWVDIEDLEFTPQVSTGGRVAVSCNVFIQSSATPAPSGGTVFQNPDYCVASDFKGGARIDANIYVDGNLKDSKGYCWPMENRERRLTFDFIAPSQAGTYTVAIQLVGQASGDVGETVEFDVQVGSTNGGNGGDTVCPEGFVKDPDTGNCVRSQDPDGGGGGGDPIDQVDKFAQYAVLGIGGIAVIKALDLLGD